MTREQRIDLCEDLLWRLLRLFDGRDRIFALTEIVRRVQSRLASRESSQYHIEFGQDERPTDPTDIGDRETRQVNVDELREAIDVSRRKL